jgi:hypothetical protein
MKLTAESILFIESIWQLHTAFPPVTLWRPIAKSPQESRGAFTTSTATSAVIGWQDVGSAVDRPDL